MDQRTAAIVIVFGILAVMVAHAGEPTIHGRTIANENLVYGGELIGNDGPSSFVHNPTSIINEQIANDDQVLQGGKGGSTAFVPQCSDGIDNDGDGRIDYGGHNGDWGCLSPSDNSEYWPQCQINAHCNDHDLWTVDVCNNGGCVHTLQLCTVMSGQVCATGTSCTGTIYAAFDTPSCCVGGCSAASSCGDGICGGGENMISCPQDCHQQATPAPTPVPTPPSSQSPQLVCDDGVCAVGESLQSCPQDCTPVHSQNCIDSDGGIAPYAAGDTIDGIDLYPDFCTICTKLGQPDEDCIIDGSLLPYGNFGNTLSEKYCVNDHVEQRIIECQCYYDPLYPGFWGYCINTAIDAAAAVCGDGVCIYPENSITCPQDCKVTALPEIPTAEMQAGGISVCGDLVCQPDELSSGSCPLDCASSAPSAVEHRSQQRELLAQTIGSTCGDGICQSQEDQSCPADCVPSDLECSVHKITVEDPLHYGSNRLYVLLPSKGKVSMNVRDMQGSHDLDVSSGNWYAMGDGRFFVRGISSRVGTQQDQGPVIEMDVQICACSDGLDNDEDGDVDFPYDRNCVADTDPDEAVDCTPQGSAIIGRDLSARCCSSEVPIARKANDLPSVMGYCTSGCGDLVCDDTTEDFTNCPSDCIMKSEGRSIGRMVRNLINSGGQP